ncbi:MAG: hypothetical protein ACO248_07485, partial [Burkholderiaceae bacterium]
MPVTDRPRPHSPADLFWSFTWLALQGFGGVLSVVQREIFEKMRWLTAEEAELLDQDIRRELGQPP